MHKKISYGGMGTALSVLLLFLAVYMPSGKIAIVFVSSLISYIIALELDKKTALIMFASTSAIAFLLLFGASPVIVTSYILCFGNYPVFKLLIDRTVISLQIILKLAIYSIYAFLMYMLCSLLFNITIPYSIVILYVVGIVIFGAYDYLLSYAGEYFRAFINKK